jgi:type 1 glutamine amidotransferase
MSVRKSKRGKVYYSCLGYPDCKFMSWDMTTGEKCPLCSSAMIKTGRGVVKCGIKDCDYKVKTEKKAKAPAQMVDDFEPPMPEEPFYFDYDDAGYFPEGFED